MTPPEYTNPYDRTPAWKRLFDLGFSLIPLKPNDKIPLIQWVEYQNHKASWQVIKSWLREWPDANIGIVTGAISNLIVVDFDSKQAYQDAQSKGLGTTVIVATGRGHHAYYRHPEGGMSNRTKFLPDTDLRSEGGYVVAPGSLHENGTIYQWDQSALTLEPPAQEATHWTVRAMAKAVGIAASSVVKIWHDHGLAPHRWRSFKLSNDKAFAEKLRDVVGLYVSPPAHAIVLSVDEKSQIQALDRTQPGLPLKRGRGATMTHDYKRNGTTTLFAALNVLDGSVIGRNMQRHRHQEFIRFLNAIEAEMPADKAIHVILDNYATHKQPKVRAWLARHPRWTFHFVPTSCSWLNAVEGFFAKLTRRRLKNGVFHSVVDLQAAINRFIKEHNQDPRPFVWRADPDEIIAAVRRGHQTLESIH